MKKLKNIFKNSDYVAVDKPQGISVHNNEDPTNLLKLLESEDPSATFFPVHRLDKETSGIQIFAFNSASAAKLANAFQSREVIKNYYGVLRGELKLSEGTWNRALTDKAEGRKNPEGTMPNRIPCETQFKVIKSNKFFSFCEFDLVTGRQHQIRKHAALANHSLVGDSRYGDAKYNLKIANLYQNDRMFLHCGRLVILGHEIICPTPDEFLNLLNPSTK